MTKGNSQFDNANIDGVDTINQSRMKGTSRAIITPAICESRLTIVHLRDPNKSSERKNSISAA